MNSFQFQGFKTAPNNIWESPVLISRNWYFINLKTKLSIKSFKFLFSLIESYSIQSSLKLKSHSKSSTCVGSVEPFKSLSGFARFKNITARKSEMWVDVNSKQQIRLQNGVLESCGERTKETRGRWEYALKAKSIEILSQSALGRKICFSVMSG